MYGPRVFLRSDTDAIAAEASVGRTTLYRNFADRYALALAVMERRIEDVAAIADEHHDRPDTFLLMVRKSAGGADLRW